MSTNVRTAITNLNRSPYAAKVGRNKRITIRGGETIKVPYDLFSVLSRAEQAEYTLLEQRGKLKIDTEVITQDNTIVISQAGDVSIKVGPEEVQQTSTKKAALPPATFSKDKELGGHDGVVIAGGSNKVVSAMGLTTDSTMNGKIKDVEIKNGKLEPIQADKKDVFAHENHNNLPKVESVNVFPQNKTGSPKGVTEEAVKEVTKEPEGPDEETQLNELLSNKDYSMLYAYLNDNYPKQFAAVTKTAVKKCKNYTELKELLGI